MREGCRAAEVSCSFNVDVRTISKTGNEDMQSQ